MTTNTPANPDDTADPVDPVVERFELFVALMLERLQAKDPNAKEAHAKKELAKVWQVGQRAVQNYLKGKYPVDLERTDTRVRIDNIDAAMRRMFPTYAKTAYRPLADLIKDTQHVAPPDPPQPDPTPQPDPSPDPRRPYLLVLAATALLVIGLAAALAFTLTHHHRDTPTPTRATFTFNDLGGGYPTIHVYPGTTDTTADKTPDGTYKSGDTMEAICQTNGRPVHSDPTDGELKRDSTTWILIPSPPEDPRFASLVYGDLNIPLTDLPTCTTG